MTVNGWTLFAHPLFLDQLAQLIEAVEKLRAQDPVGYLHKHATRRLAAIDKWVFDAIPQDPTRPEYRQGNTLGEEHRHWFRAKFFQQDRLFFRYHQLSRIIVFAWVHDEGSKRAHGSGDDAYRIFRRMLDDGHPPDDWVVLLSEATQAADRLRKTALRSL